jgi:hypothetical protein
MADEAIKLSRAAAVPALTERYLRLAEQCLRLAKVLATNPTADNDPPDQR